MRLRPTFAQGLIILLGGCAFAFFSCLGALAGGMTGNYNPTPLFVLGAVGFVAGGLAAVLGGVLLLLTIFKLFFGKRDGVS
jgi:hypothetical protein